MVFNVKFILNSNKSMTDISLAMSKIVLSLEKFNERYEKYLNITTLNVKTNKIFVNQGEIITQILIKDSKIIDKFISQLEYLLDEISQNYKVEIKKVMLER